ncbi:MAG TPA: YndJ family protein [Pyrinomonadaceae bacterium]|nr:YndJ family protein [Pyrinomonadaceae bacterium]
MSSLSKFARISAVAGVVAWLLLLLTTTSNLRETEVIHKVVFFGMLVVVPLGLSLVPLPGEQGPLLYRLAILIQPVAALPAIASFYLEVGPLAAALSSSWTILSVLIALIALIRLKSRGLYPIAESSIDAGLLYLPVAGVWLIVYRLGIQPFDYGETIILLTVVHFHFAGFAAPIIAGMSGRFLATRKHPRAVFSFSVFAIVASMPLVAAGITFSPWLGLVGTLLLSAGLVMLAVLTAGWVLPAITPLTSRLLLLIGALCSCAAMALACLYAYSLPMKLLIIDIPTMALTHGLLNAFGFVACSLVAWTLVKLT